MQFFYYKYANCVNTSRTCIVKNHINVIMCTYTCVYVFILNICEGSLTFIYHTLLLSARNNFIGQAVMLHSSWSLGPVHNTSCSFGLTYSAISTL